MVSRAGIHKLLTIRAPDPGVLRLYSQVLLEEVAVRIIADGGQVAAVGRPPAGIAARLRFSLAPGEDR